MYQGFAFRSLPSKLYSTYKPRRKYSDVRSCFFPPPNIVAFQFSVVVFFSLQTNSKMRTGVRAFQQTKANSTKTRQLQTVQRILNRLQSQLLVRIPHQEGKNVHPFHSLTADVSSKYQKAMIKAGQLGSRKCRRRPSVVSPLVQSRLYENTALR